MTRDELGKCAYKLCTRRCATNHDPVLVPCDECLGGFAWGEQARSWFRRLMVSLLHR